MVRILKPDKQVLINAGVVIFVRSDGTVNARLVQHPEVINTTGYACVILLTEEEENDKVRVGGSN